MKELLNKINSQKNEMLDQYVINKLDKLHKWSKLPIGIGIISSIIYIFLYGLSDYIRIFLQWVIGVTMVVIFIEYITRNGERNV